jgi:hypothetical protein
MDDPKLAKDTSLADDDCQQQPQQQSQPQLNKKREQRLERRGGKICSRDARVGALEPLRADVCHRVRMPGEIGCQCQFVTDHVNYQKGIRKSYSAFVESSRDANPGNKLLVTFITPKQKFERDKYGKNVLFLYRVCAVNPKNGVPTEEPRLICSPVFRELFGLGSRRFQKLQQMSKKISALSKQSAGVDMEQDGQPRKANEMDEERRTKEHSKLVISPQEDSKLVISPQVAAPLDAGDAHVMKKETEEATNEESKLVISPQVAAPIDAGDAHVMEKETEEADDVMWSYICVHSCGKKAVEGAAVGLALASENPMLEEETIAKRANYVRVCVKDYRRLSPRRWLNDNLIDFWMQW